MDNNTSDINDDPAFLPNVPPPYTIFLNENMQGKEIACTCGKIYTWLEPDNTLLCDMKKDPVISEFLMKRYKYDTSKDNTNNHRRSHEVDDYDYRRRSPSYHSHSPHRDYYHSRSHSRSRYSQSRSPSPYYDRSYSHRHKRRRRSRSRSRSSSSHQRWSYHESQPLQIPQIQIQQPIQPVQPIQPIQSIQQQQQIIGIANHPQKPLELSELEVKYKGKTMEEVGEEILVNEMLDYNRKNGLNTNIDVIKEKVRLEMVKNQVLLRIEKILQYWKKCSLSKIQSFYEETYGEKIDSTRFLGYKKLGKCLQMYGFTLKPVPDDTIVYPTYRLWF